MRPRHIMLALAALAGAGAGSFATAATLKGGALAGRARITLAAARIAALKARHGTITDQELETEQGGSGLRYSFDIISKGKPYELGVDARTGAILENVAEGKKPY